MTCRVRRCRPVAALLGLVLLAGSGCSSAAVAARPGAHPVSGGASGVTPSGGSEASGTKESGAIAIAVSPAKAVGSGNLRFRFDAIDSSTATGLSWSSPGQQTSTDSVLFPGALVGGVAGVIVAVGVTEDDISAGDKTLGMLFYAGVGAAIGALIDLLF